MKPRLHRARDEAAATLRELLDYRRQISDQLVATGNRCELAGRILRERLEILRALLATELEQTDALIKTHIHEDDSLRTKATRLRELQGAGPVLAATLLAYVPEWTRKDRIGPTRRSDRCGPIRPRQRAATSLPTCARRASFRAPGPLHGGGLCHPM
ncbi:MAG: hypothetical protein J6386_05075 [Candidatus Synoicihabitans palmerolidicus]|nr:hypothetical protein [Candidatus Synoicihabitans palmerolidicus]